MGIFNPAADYFDCPHGSHDTGTCWGDSIYQDFTYPVEIDGFYIGDRHSAYDYVQDAEGGAKQRQRYQAIIDQTDSYFDERASITDNEESVNTEGLDSEIGSSNQDSIAKEILEELLSLPGFTGFGSNVSVTNNTTNIINNTNNNTTTSISNSGSGNITVGNIGTVNNTTTIDNSFTIQTTNINLSLAITGDSKKSEKVEGTDGDDLIADGRGKDKLIGGDGADQFYFAGEEPFKKKTVDKVIDFDASEGDAIVIADEVVGDLTEDPTLAIADTKKELKQLSKDGYDLLYFEPKGDLYVDGNGDSKGFGKKSEGGMIADLPNETILTESDVLIGV